MAEEMKMEEYYFFEVSKFADRPTIMNNYESLMALTLLDDPIEYGKYAEQKLSPRTLIVDKKLYSTLGFWLLEGEDREYFDLLMVQIVHDVFGFKKFGIALKSDANLSAEDVMLLNLQSDEIRKMLMAMVVPVNYFKRFKGMPLWQWMCHHKSSIDYFRRLGYMDNAPVTLLNGVKTLEDGLRVADFAKEHCATIVEPEASQLKKTFSIKKRKLNA
jgi:hypothetical protein